MSEVEEKFIAECDKRFARMQNFLLSIIGIILTASLTVGAIQIAGAAAVKLQQDINTVAIKYIMDNSVSQKGIDMLITSFENQTKTMEEYLPNDVAGAMSHFNEVSSNFRSYILQYQSFLNSRGGKKYGTN